MTCDNYENIKMIRDYLKESGIKKLVISPGGTNIPLVKIVQDDDSFECYSVVDERSAIYFAIGLYLQSGEPIATICTSAQATRNYVPGLTEAFYKHVPILAITMEKHPRFKYQEYMQAPDQCSLPNDSVKKSFELPFVRDINDLYHSRRVINEAILELTRDGMGPVQLCVPWLDFNIAEVKPAPRKIERYSSENLSSIDLSGKKILLAIGEHRPLNGSEQEAINHFCENTNSVVYVNHLSNFSNNYSVHGNLVLSTITDEEFIDLKPDIFITIGGQTGDYPFYLRFSKTEYGEMEHWRVSDDGLVVDTYDKLTRIYQCSIQRFFDSIQKADTDHSFYKKWQEKSASKNTSIPVPFSSVSVAQTLHEKIQPNSIVQFSILNTLRVWNLFPLKNGVECYSNVGAFGIDGGMSTLIGQSVASGKLSIMIVGDLAFCYDINSLSIRHIGNNLRILLINNDGGIEFKLGNPYDKQIDQYIAAAGHFKNAQGWAETCGFEYISANNQTDFEKQVPRFLGESKRPIIFEVFTSDIDESDAYGKIIDSNRHKSVQKKVKDGAKETAKSILGEKRLRTIKRILKGGKS